MNDLVDAPGLESLLRVTLDDLGGLNFGSNLIDVLLRLRPRLDRLRTRENRMALCRRRDR
jgi:hypothetical protein